MKTHWHICRDGEPVWERTCCVSWIAPLNMLWAFSSFYRRWSLLWNTRCCLEWIDYVWLMKESGSRWCLRTFTKYWTFNFVQKHCQFNALRQLLKKYLYCKIKLHDYWREKGFWLKCCSRNHYLVSWHLRTWLHFLARHEICTNNCIWLQFTKDTNTRGSKTLVTFTPFHTNLQSLN